MQKALLTLALAAAMTEGQTLVDLSSQARRIDFTNAPFTRPVKTGDSLPAACQAGDLFFLTAALAGRNLHGCVPPGNWTLLGDGITSLPTLTGNPGDMLTTDGSVLIWSTLAGDLAGPPASTRVTGIQNRPLSPAAPQPGNVLTWNDSSRLWEPAAAVPTPTTIKAGGTVIGTRGSTNFLTGTGLITALSDNGTDISVQQDIDTSVMQTRAGAQAGTVHLCNSIKVSGSEAYRCAMNPMLSRYTTGMVLHWILDQPPAGGAVTLDIDTLGAHAVKRDDGINDPAAGELVAGRLYAIWHDGSGFRLLHSAPPEVSSGVRPACDAAMRGRFWYIAGASGFADELTVCMKDASDSFGWRTL